MPALIEGVPHFGLYVSRSLNEEIKNHDRGIEARPYCRHIVAGRRVMPVGRHVVVVTSKSAIGLSTMKTS